MTDLVGFTFAAHPSAQRRCCCKLVGTPSESMSTVVTVGGWARRGLMQHCMPSALELRGEGWVIQRRKICSSTMSLRVCVLSAFSSKQPKS